MRFEFVLVGALAAIAGCQHERGYTACCPHCNQVHAPTATGHALPPNVPISPVTHADGQAPKPITRTTVAPVGSVNQFLPVPAAPGVEE